MKNAFLINSILFFNLEPIIVILIMTVILTGSRITLETSLQHICEVLSRYVNWGETTHLHCGWQYSMGLTLNKEEKVS